MKLYKYKSYEDYVKQQTEANKRKLNRVAAEEKVLNEIVVHFVHNYCDAKLGLCHGVRNSFEVKYLRGLLNFNIIGTDISDTATQFENTIQWDFHKIKNGWVNNVDFIYSNALDHSYDPVMCLGTWLSCLTDKGFCYIEWSFMCNTPDGGIKDMHVDCFGASLDEYREVLSRQSEIVDEIKVSIDNKWAEERGFKDDRIVFVLRRLL